MDNNKFISAELSVSRKEYITPDYIRVFLTGDDVPLFKNATVGVNNKILIPPKGVDKVHFPQFDKNKPQTLLPDGLRPAMRTYTHRGIHLERNEIWIDFVAHGDEGPASAWAIGAEPGDVLGVLMKKRQKYVVCRGNELPACGRCNSDSGAGRYSGRPAADCESNLHHRGSRQGK